MSDYNTEMDNIKEDNNISKCYVSDLGDWIHVDDCKLICFQRCGWCNMGIVQENDYTYRCPGHTKKQEPVYEDKWYTETDNNWKRLLKTKTKMERNGRITNQIRENINVRGQRWFFNYQREKEPENKVLPADTRAYAKEYEK